MMVNNKLESVWMEAMVALFKELPKNLTGGTEKFGEETHSALQ
jgi:hypothetical protein